MLRAFTGSSTKQYEADRSSYSKEKASYKEERVTYDDYGEETYNDKDTSAKSSQSNSSEKVSGNIDAEAARNNAAYILAQDLIDPKMRLFTKSVVFVNTFKAFHGGEFVQIDPMFLSIIFNKPFSGQMMPYQNMM